MTNSAHGIRLDKALKALSDRFQTNDLSLTNPVNGPPPPYQNEYVSRVAAAANLSQSNGPDAIIDVQFDYRNSLLYITNCITKEYPDVAFKPHPCLTPMSYIGYSMALQYALALLNDDDNIRSVKSTYAQQFTNDRLLSPVINELRNLYVPPFMEQILRSNTYSNDDRKRNLRYVYSLACFDYTHDFGRCFPINIFFLAHHVIATNQTNTPVNQILTTWLNSNVIETPEVVTVEQFIGMDHNVPNLTNWLNRPLLQAFNPVTARSNTLRPTFSQMNTRPQNHGPATVNTINPYIYLLCLDPKNIKEVRLALSSISKAVKDNYPSAKTLAEMQLVDQSSQLLNHYYQGIIPPTYHKIPVTKPQADDKTTKTVADQFKFHVEPTLTQDVKFTEPAKDSLYLPCLYRSVAENYDKAQCPVKFKLSTDAYPPIDNIRHFIPNRYLPESVFQNIILGKMIETGELDSVAVPHINVHNSVLKENSFFLQSAFPMTQIQSTVLTNTNELSEVIRKVHRCDVPQVRIDILSRQTDRIPLFGPYVEAAIGDSIPGYDSIRHVPSTQFACNSHGHTIDTELETVTSTTHVRLPVAWSSYRYLNVTPYTEEIPRDKKFFILNQRTLYGTNVTLKETEHPSNIIDLS